MNFTKEQTQYFRDNFDKLSYAQMGEDVGIPKSKRSLVAKFCKELGLIRPSGRDFDEHVLDDWHPDSAYLIGYLVADGNVCFEEGKHYDVIIRSCAKDVEHLEKIRSLFKAKKPLKYIKSTNSYCLGLSSKHLCLRLIELGVVPNKTNFGVFIEVPDEYLREFVCGMFDADGCMSVDKRHAFKWVSWHLFQSSNSIPFLKYLQTKIENQSGSYLSLLKNKDTLYYLQASCSNADKLCAWMYSGNSISMDRKKQRYLTHIKLLRNEIH